MSTTRKKQAEAQVSRLETLAAALRADPAIPEGTEVHLYGPGPVALLAEAGGQRRAACYFYADGHTEVIEVAELALQGIRFHAQFSRTATPDERAAGLLGQPAPQTVYHVAPVEPAHV